MHRVVVSTWIAALVVLSASSLLAQERRNPRVPEDDSKAAAKAEGEVKAVCPVGGEPIDRRAYTHYRGKRVYFCCKDCLGKFDKDPESFAKQVKAQWEALKPHRTQVTCPVTGKPVNAKFWVDTPACDIFFADEQAKAAWEKDSKAYEAKLADCYTFQTTCPASGRDINPGKFIEVKGKRVYFCCDGCKGEAEKAPEETLKKVEDQIAKNQKAFDEEQP